MFTIEGTVHHGDGNTSKFLLNPDDNSWTQWGGPVELLGNTRDYIDAMAHGLHIRSDYFVQDDADDGDRDEDQDEGIVEGVVHEEPETMPAPPRIPYRGPGTVYHDKFQEMSASYADEKYGKPLADLTDTERYEAEQTTHMMFRVAPLLLPSDERARLGIIAD